MKTCLIVDDSQVVRKTLRRIIEDMGYNCVESENGVAAYDICRGQMPDVITLDWHMPVMDGYDFLTRLRRTAGGERPKIIICSSETDMRQMRRALDAGADEYVMKPFDNAIIRSKFALLGLTEAA